MAPTATDARSASLRSAAAWSTRARSRPRSRRWAPRTRSPGRSRPSDRRLGFAVSFQKTSSVIIDMAHRIEPDRSLLLPRHRAALPGDLRDPRRARRALRDRVRALRQDNPPAASRALGWRASSGARRTTAARRARSRRCARALDGAECWVSGIRRVDSETRAERRQVRLGQAVRALEAEPARRLGRQASLEPHQGPSRPVQPTSRPGLPVDRLHALHHEARRGRGPARRPLGRHRPDRVRQLSAYDR